MTEDAVCWLRVRIRSWRSRQVPVCLSGQQPAGMFDESLYRRRQQGEHDVFAGAAMPEPHIPSACGTSASGSMLRPRKRLGSNVSGCGQEPGS